MTRPVKHKRGQGQGGISTVRTGCTCSKAPGRHTVWKVRPPVLGYLPSGSPITPSQTVHGTKADAGELLDELKVAKRAGMLTSSAGTLAEFLDQWIETASAQWARSTTRRNAGIVKTITASLGEIKLRDLNAGHVARMYADLTRSGAGPGTVWRVHAVLSKALDTAVAWKAMGSGQEAEIIRGAKKARPTVTRRDPVVPSDADVDAQEAEAELIGPLWADALALAATTGLRRSELCALRWQDIRPAAISVAQSLDYQNRKDWKLKEPKGHQVAEVPLSDSAREVLERRHGLASSVEPESFVFSESADGAMPVDPNRLSKMARLARDSAGIGSDVRPVHGRRGWLITEVEASGGISEARAFARHKDISTTQRYVGRKRESTALALEAIDRARRNKELPA